jgi:phenylpyruvate tautomerase PptA (4-oxalocrotonate tautomerase family)
MPSYTVIPAIFTLTAEQESAIAVAITEAHQALKIAGIGPEDIWLHIHDVPAAQMVEFGRILPELGHKGPRHAGFGAQKLKELADAGVTV